MRAHITFLLFLSFLLLSGCQAQVPVLTPPVNVQPTVTPQPTPKFTPQQPSATPTSSPAPSPEPPDPTSSPWQETSEDWAELTCGEFLLTNNVWGKGDLTDYDQAIAITGDPGSCRFRWSWRWPLSGLNSVRAYPEIIYGWKPWSPASTTPSLPIQVSAIQDLSVQINFTTQPVGTYNTAFDLWLTSTNPPTGDTITREVMIWLGDATMTPAGVKSGSFEIDGVSYELYKIQWDWTYLAFVQKSTPPTATIPIAELLQYLVDNQHLQPSEFLASIEFGNEIINGDGETLVDDFTITIK